MPNQIDISNRALAAAGAREQIISFNENSESSIQCNLLFQPTFEELARKALWNCLRLQTGLTLLKAAQGTPENQTGTILPIPPQPWLYEYLLPTDCLYVRYLRPLITQGATPVPIFPFPSSVCPTRPPYGQIDFAVATDYVSNSLTKVILTNLSMAQIVYTQNNPNPDFWDSDFQAAMVASLAAYLIPPLNLNMNLLAKQTQIAENIVATAQSRDANEGVTTQDRTPDWIRARGAGNEIDYVGEWDTQSWGGW